MKPKEEEEETCLTPQTVPQSALGLTDGPRHVPINCQRKSAPDQAESWILVYTQRHQFPGAS